MVSKQIKDLRSHSRSKSITERNDETFKQSPQGVLQGKFVRNYVVTVK